MLRPPYQAKKYHKQGVRLNDGSVVTVASGKGQAQLDHSAPERWRAALWTLQHPSKGADGDRGLSRNARQIRAHRVVPIADSFGPTGAGAGCATFLSRACVANGCSGRKDGVLRNSPTRLSGGAPYSAMMQGALASLLETIWWFNRRSGRTHTRRRCAWRRLRGGARDRTACRNMGARRVSSTLLERRDARHGCIGGAAAAGRSAGDGR